MSFTTSISEHIALARQLEQTGEPLVAGLSALIVESLKAGSKTLLFGNGGSAADAQHIATELTVRFQENRRALPAIALTTDTSALTAIGNDFGFDSLFSRQVEALCRPGDVVVGISTSGNSENVVRGLEAANDIGATTVALTGGSGGRIKDIAQHALIIPSTNTARIQEMHIMIGHMLCAAVESELAGAS
jgi:D-sedoheptulose 7-phosphate isomerase